MQVIADVHLLNMGYWDCCFGLMIYWLFNYQIKMTHRLCVDNITFLIFFLLFLFTIGMEIPPDLWLIHVIHAVL